MGELFQEASQRPATEKFRKEQSLWKRNGKTKKLCA